MHIKPRSLIHIFTFVTLAIQLSLRRVAATVQGQSLVNNLRHAVAVSNLPSQFGKKGSALLSRHVVPKAHIWRDIPLFMRELLSNPARLDWWVADLNGETVTLNAGFSCLDRGKSSSVPLTWWGSRSMSELESLQDAPGGAVLGSSKAATEASVNDITDQCLKQRTPDLSLRLVEHHGQHDGTGVSFQRVQTNPDSVVDDVTVFDQIATIRQNEDRSNDVVYHPKRIPIVVGLTFDTGMRIITYENFTTEKTQKLRVPMTPLAAITYHTGARLEEARVAEGQPPTTFWILALTQLSTSLGLLFAIWIVFRYISNTTIERAMELRDQPVHVAVRGGEKWTIIQKRDLLLNIGGVTILLAPAALAVVERKLDPRVFLEVTTGVTVFYGSSQGDFSSDSQNPVAGAPFIVTGWMSVQKLNSNYTALLWVLNALTIAIAARIVWLDLKRMNEVMPKNDSNRFNFSLFKRIGRLWLGWSSSKGDDTSEYVVCITLLEKHFRALSNTRSDRTRLKELLLLANRNWRKRAAEPVQRKEGGMSSVERRADTSGEVCKVLMDTIGNRFALLCRIRLHNLNRFEAMMSRIGSVWSHRCPREWEYIRRSLGCFPMEYYHTRALYPPDVALLLLRLGLLNYLKFIDEVNVLKIEDGGDFIYDDDDTNCVLALTSTSQTFGVEAPRNGGDTEYDRTPIRFHTYHGREEIPDFLKMWRDGSLWTDVVRVNSENFGFVNIDSLTSSASERSL
ncbi:hypothetical protein BWQ96_00694 [Gracilariopsis chorda]|uniref:Transmembrane protein n=1 Tax=Gracilariopsis chorda TaxID=448386 RepID=A0A2V3J4M5_9FLOR|nr:hypothetical protein BWQ96_00694 [Gracilariopsis chorda]|eukprot:PXF49378.1 hypothetical protein BWQ96_00694 [Gracilariopsis chorda]